MFNAAQFGYTVAGELWKMRKRARVFPARWLNHFAYANPADPKSFPPPPPPMHAACGRRRFLPNSTRLLDSRSHILYTFARSFPSLPLCPLRRVRCFSAKLERTSRAIHFHLLHKRKCDLRRNNAKTAPAADAARVWTWAAHDESLRMSNSTPGKILFKNIEVMLVWFK